jgi:hypothetical protein
MPTTRLIVTFGKLLSMFVAMLAAEAVPYSSSGKTATTIWCFPTPAWCIVVGIVLGYITGRFMLFIEEILCGNIFHT